MNIIFLRMTSGDMGAASIFTVIIALIAIYFIGQLIEILNYQKEGITKLSEAAEELKSEKLAEAGKNLLKAHSMQRILTNIHITLVVISIVGAFLLLTNS